LPNVPALLAPVILGGHVAQASLLTWFSWKIVAGIGICGLISSCLLAGPVMADRAMDTFTARVKKIAPATFVIGAVILVAGLIIGLPALDVIGGIMSGSVLVLLIVKHY
jgi:hypothetical protein